MVFVHSTCEETCVGNSRQNKGEVECIVSIVDKLVRARGVHAKLIGIVAPYIALCNMLREKLPAVESIGTVDSFQSKSALLLLFRWCCPMIVPQQACFPKRVV